MAIAAAFVSSGGSITGLVGLAPARRTRSTCAGWSSTPGEIRVLVRNPQADDITIASVTVDDAVYPFTTDGPDTIGRLRSTHRRDPLRLGGGRPVHDRGHHLDRHPDRDRGARRRGDPGASGRSVGGYALIGFLVGVVPIGLGMLWLPSLRRADPRLLAGFMALTGGLLTFLAVDALSEALDLQAGLPGALGGPGLVLLGVAASYLALSWVAQRFSARGGASGVRGQPLQGLALASLIAVGIGLHNLGEGLAIGSSFAVGELALGTFLIVGFMVHNVTEGLGIAVPVAEGRPVGVGRLALLALVAGAPAIAGAWIGGFLVNDVLAVLFFSIAVGAALQVVVEVGRYLARRAPGGLASGWVVGGFLAGVVVMYLTGLLAG